MQPQPHRYLNRTEKEVVSSSLSLLSQLKNTTKYDQILKSMSLSPDCYHLVLAFKRGSHVYRDPSLTLSVTSALRPFMAGRLKYFWSSATNDCEMLRLPVKDLKAGTDFETSARCMVRKQFGPVVCIQHVTENCRSYAKTRLTVEMVLWICCICFWKSFNLMNCLIICSLIQHINAKTLLKQC